MDYGKLCNEILSVDPKVRYAGVCDDTGETKYGGQREGVKNLLSSEETKKSNLQALARWALRNTLSPKIGKGRYAMAEYEKIKRITIPLEDNNHLVLITTEVDVNHDRIIDHVMKFIQHSSDDYVSDA
ncbi:MAG TPA: DUF6659 family protein [Nitrososphaeraceae archaeon]|jgi:hypothetical protein|nr:DUF6659 family protein [Nitrososphaeraceae archaeon]